MKKLENKYSAHVELYIKGYKEHLSEDNFHYDSRLLKGVI